MKSPSKKSPASRSPQEDYYFRVEADAYFKRNLPAMTQEDMTKKAGRQAITGKLRLIELAQRAGLKPKAALDIGGSSGYFISEFQKIFKCKGTLVEPSVRAVAYAGEHYRNIKALRGIASKLPLDDNSVDTVIIKGVFCWIGRETLLRAIAEIDRVLVNGGHILISDFHPDAPRKTINRHAADANIYCFKTDHSRILLDTGMYSVIASEIYIDENDVLRGGDMYDFRHQNTILRKSYSDYYRTKGT